MDLSGTAPNDDRQTIPRGSFDNRGEKRRSSLGSCRGEASEREGRREREREGDSHEKGTVTFSRSRLRPESVLRAPHRVRRPCGRGPCGKRDSHVFMLDFNPRPGRVRIEIYAELIGQRLQRVLSETLRVVLNNESQANTRHTPLPSRIPSGDVAVNELLRETLDFRCHYTATFLRQQLRKMGIKSGILPCGRTRQSHSHSRGNRAVFLYFPLWKCRNNTMP